MEHKKDFIEENISEKSYSLKELDKVTLILSAGFLLVFVIFTIFDSHFMTSVVNLGFKYSTQFFGAYWQILLLATFIIGLVLAISTGGNAVLGRTKDGKPEMSTFKWLSIIMCTLLAGGGVFWAGAEPIAHFMSPDPMFAVTSDPFQKAVNALSTSFMHWGFLAWAILGTLTTIVLMHLHYDKGLPLKPRTILYPLFGQRIIDSWVGSVVDAFCIVGAAAGTIGPIGFLGLQISYGLKFLFHIPDNFTAQVIIVLAAMLIYTVSALTGLAKGITFLSKWNTILAIFLMVFIFLFGPTKFIIDSFTQGLGSVIQHLVPMALYRGDTGWVNAWTVFFWGWFMGFGPIMAVFMSTITRGRSVRTLILSVSILAPLITFFWYTIVGGSGLAAEIAHPGIISGPFTGFNLPAALLAITEALPWGTLMSILFLILSVAFIVTTGDSITYTISVVTGGGRHPHPYLRAFWGILMGAMAIALISIGSSGVSAIQSFIIIAAVPVSIIILPTLWNGPQLAMKMAREQEKEAREGKDPKKA